MLPSRSLTRKADPFPTAPSVSVVQCGSCFCSPGQTTYRTRFYEVPTYRLYLPHTKRLFDEREVLIKEAVTIKVFQSDRKSKSFRKTKSIFRCVSCMGRIFASKQNQNRPEQWMTGKSPCPTCRATFCVLDVCYFAQP